MLALATTFATLTIAATIIDVINGHRGPWAESAHLIELVAIILLWHLTPPHLLPWHPPADHSQPEPVEQRRSLRLVPPRHPTDEPAGDDRLT
ncbi:MAG: hypothetical protein ACFCVK_19750 [Acidimicrobiales bacterium]